MVCVDPGKGGGGGPCTVKSWGGGGSLYREVVGGGGSLYREVVNKAHSRSTPSLHQPLHLSQSAGG